MLTNYEYNKCSYLFKNYLKQNSAQIKLNQASYLGFKVDYYKTVYLPRTIYFLQKTMENDTATHLKCILYEAKMHNERMFARSANKLQYLSTGFAFVCSLTLKRGERTPCLFISYTNIVFQTIDTTFTHWLRSHYLSLIILTFLTLY